MKAIISILAGATMAATMPAAGAQDIQASGIYKDASEIHDVCKSTDEGDIALCENFLMGVYDAISYFTDLGKIDKAICVGTGTKAVELRLAFVAYVDAKPDRRKYSAVSIAYNAFFGASINACATE